MAKSEVTVERRVAHFPGILKLAVTGQRGDDSLTENDNFSVHRALRGNLTSPKQQSQRLPGSE
ncbi:hypothetical protein [Ureibacillus aquaedulcis]|uniref:Uncharacterized protein n=1 Tax=Ureibacillus aquaedulcis TaxID=3058421 RepID=A0ABT8GNR3_9BACL|nr:hypothetical protein [Ureibacillus sp. BA0131]MDN4492931.1 hypothetical protein [Ureibacillus sp. BA0131]